MKILLLIVALAIPASAEHTIQSCADAHEIVEQIRADLSGYAIEGDGTNCKLVYIPKPGKTITFIDRKARRDALLTELSTLEAKLDDGTVSPAETRRLIKIMMRLLRVSKDG